MFEELSSSLSLSADDYVNGADDAVTGDAVSRAWNRVQSGDLGLASDPETAELRPPRTAPGRYVAGGQSVGCNSVELSGTRRCRKARCRVGSVRTRS